MTPILLYSSRPLPGLSENKDLDGYGYPVNTVHHHKNESSTHTMPPQMQEPLYTTIPWSPSNVYPKDQDPQASAAGLYPCQGLITPVECQTQHLPETSLDTFQPEPAFISPITPGLIAPAPTPEAFTYPNQQLMPYAQYPTQSPWSSCSDHQQLLTPQYPFFPATIFTYPQPSQQFSQYPYPQNDINVLSHYTFPINQGLNTEQNGNGKATEDLYRDNTAYAYSTSFETTQQHDKLQLPSKHEALVHNASIGNQVGSEQKGHRIQCELIDPPLLETNQSIPQPSINETNSINIDQFTSRNFIPKSQIFRSDPRSLTNTAEPTIDPNLSCWGNLDMGGEESRASGTRKDPEHDRFSVIPIRIPTPPCPVNIVSHEHEYEHEDQSPTPTKRGRWSTSSIPLFSRKSTTTPLRKRRPAQLHLPPPAANMRIPTATIHSAPAASFSLDLFIPPTQRVDTATAVPQEPPKVVGWVSPEQRPVPPPGYTVPGSELVPKIFEYGNQDDLPVPAVSIGVSVDNITTRPVPPQALPFQPYEPKAITRVTSDPQLRIPNTSTPSPPIPYIIVPGLNGFEVSYWRPQTHTRYPDITLIGQIPVQPPTTAAPWEVSVPPMDPSLPPSTASSLQSISTHDGHFIPQAPQEVEPVVYLNHELRNRVKTRVYHPPRYHVPIHEKKESWAICEVCNATISRTSDLQVSALLFQSEIPADD